MKKMFIVAFIVSAALAACGGKKKPAPTGPTGGSDMGSAAGSGEMGSAAPAPDGAGSGAGSGGDM